MDKNKPKIKIVKNGPYLVSGNVPLNKLIIKKGKDGHPDRYEETQKYPGQAEYSLCRCGKTKTPPFCDGSHAAAHFDGTETASNKPFSEIAEKLEGSKIDMLDAVEYCASAKFCDRGVGTWQAVEESADPEKEKMAIEEACACPSGRLVALGKDGTQIEPNFPPSISVLEDQCENISGPFWVKGGIEIEGEDGKIYEKRNRVTLCRCGKSENKPFCDTRHIISHFNDGDKSINK